MRFLANKEKQTERLSFASSFGIVVTKTIEHFLEIHLLDRKEAELLRVTKKLRDKLLHGELKTLVNILEVNFGKFEGPSVRQGKFSGEPGADIVKELEDMISGKTSVDVNTQTFKAVGHFGFLLEAHQIGAIARAIDVFRQAIRIVDKVSEAHANLSPKRR